MHPALAVVWLVGLAVASPVPSATDPPSPASPEPLVAPTAALPPQHPALAGARDLAGTVRTGDTPAAARQLLAEPPDRRLWTARQLGRLLADQPNERLLQLAGQIPATAVRVALLTGVAQARTDDSSRSTYDTLFHVPTPAAAHALPPGPPAR